MTIIQSWKKQSAEGVELLNPKSIKTFGEMENSKYLGILETNSIKQMEMKKIIRKDFFRRTRKLPETNINSRNLTKEIHTWAVAIVRYLGLSLKWTRVKKTDKWTLILPVALVRYLGLFLKWTRIRKTDKRTTGLH